MTKENNTVINVTNVTNVSNTFEIQNSDSDIIEPTTKETVESTKNEIIGMMHGEVQYTEQYTQTIDKLLALPDLPQKIVPKVKKNQPIISKKKNKSGKRRVVDFSKWPTGDVVAKERRRRYGMESQITRKEWGSAYRPARIK